MIPETLRHIFVRPLPLLDTSVREEFSWGHLPEAWVVFLLVVPEHSGGQYLKALARISRFFRDATFRQRLAEGESLEDVVGAIEEEDAKL